MLGTDLIMKETEQRKKEHKKEENTFEGRDIRSVDIFVGKISLVESVPCTLY